MRELAEARFYAAEGLSVSRTAALLGRGRGALGAAASRYGIKFNSEERGAPLGNRNRLGKKGGEREGAETRSQ